MKKERLKYICPEIKMLDVLGKVHIMVGSKNPVIITNPDSDNSGTYPGSTLGGGNPVIISTPEAKSKTDAFQFNW
jgi:hypothetical protein